MDILADLNPQQQEAVTYTGGPLLVIAGPGSGKTRIIVRRAAYFVLYRNLAPEHVLAITFTNRAAEEMRGRLHALLQDRADAMWIYTFHAAALRLLRRFGQYIGLPEDVAVADEETQRYILLEILRDMNLSLELHPLHMLADFISRRKARLLDPTHPLEGDPIPPVWLEVARRYQDVLTRERLLDFDDIIERAVHLLRARDHVRERVQHALTHILVDEYQDINPAQFTFLTLLAPPHAEVTAVADEDQSIYGWRGADPHLVDRFKRHYHPHIVRLAFSYRSTGHILYTAQKFVAKRRLREEQTFLRTLREDGLPVRHLIFQTLEQEQLWIVKLVEKAVKEWGYTYKDVAILYRVHTLADGVEQALVQQGIPVQRISPRDPLRHDVFTDIVRYLALLHVPTDHDYVQVLQFPTALVDEPTQALAQIIARKAGKTLGYIFQHPEQFPQLGPLTRAQLTRFREEIRSLQTQARKWSLNKIVDAVFDLLAQRRSPFTREETQAIRELQQEAHAQLPVQKLIAHIQGQGTLALSVDPELTEDVDAQAALVLLTHMLGEIGNVDLDPASPVHVRIRSHFLEIEWKGGEVDRVAMTVSRALDAWLLAGEILGRLEPAGQGEYVVYDVETTGTHVRRDEIVEIAAQRYQAHTPIPPPFYALVRPTRHNFIPQAATRIHGIAWEHVQEAPTIDHILPQFLDYIEENILVGHNIREFDNRFLDRALGEHLGRGLTNPTVDTLDMARRLFPELRRHTLEFLTRHLGLAEGQSHRAGEDVIQTAALYQRLLQENRHQRVREGLPETLPPLAVALLSRNATLRPACRALISGARRVLERFPHHPLLDALVASLEEEGQWQTLNTIRYLWDVPLKEDPEEERWQRWHTLFSEMVQRYEQAGGEPTLAGFLDYQALRTPLDSYDPEKDAVTLMTLHNAKGTGFGIVVIVGLEEGHLPLWTTREDEAARNEERRVLYVGMTRARDRLYLTTVLDRHDGIQRSPSPYVFELDPLRVQRYQIDRRGRVIRPRGEA